MPSKSFCPFVSVLMSVLEQLQTSYYSIHLFSTEWTGKGFGATIRMEEIASSSGFPIKAFIIVADILLIHGS